VKLAAQLAAEHASMGCLSSGCVKVRDRREVERTPVESRTFQLRWRGPDYVFSATQ